MFVIPAGWCLCLILLIQFDYVFLFSRLQWNGVHRRRSSIVNDESDINWNDKQIDGQQTQSVVDNCVCVFHYQCDRNYVLITTGEGIIDERIGPNEPPQTTCANVAQICCRVPAGVVVPSSAAPVTTPPPTTTTTAAATTTTARPTTVAATTTTSAAPTTRANATVAPPAQTTVPGVTAPSLPITLPPGTIIILPTAPPSSIPTVPPGTTATPRTTAAPATTAAPVTTAAPATTVAPATTAAPATTVAPATTAAPVTTAAPATTTTLKTTVPAGTVQPVIFPTSAPVPETSPVTRAASETTAASVTTPPPLPIPTGPPTAAPVTTAAPITTPPPLPIPTGSPTAAPTTTPPPLPIPTAPPTAAPITTPPPLPIPTVPPTAAPATTPPPLPIPTAPPTAAPATTPPPLPIPTGPPTAPPVTTAAPPATTAAPVTTAAPPTVTTARATVPPIQFPTDPSVTGAPGTTVRPATPGLPGTQCGVQYVTPGRQETIDAYTSSFAEYPWMSALLDSTALAPDGTIMRNAFICGASLIQRNIALTAAHCIKNMTEGQLMVRVGDWNTLYANETLPHQDRSVSRIKRHESFNKSTLANDIALLRLEEPVVFANNVVPICLPEQGAQFVGRSCVATGWGRNAFGPAGRYQTRMRKVTLPVIDRDRCIEMFRATRLGFAFQFDESFICAGGQQNLDTCTGDGGGPLACQTPSGTYVQAGITSWGIGCGGRDVPGAYVDVGLFSSWISSSIIELNRDTIPK